VQSYYSRCLAGWVSGTPTTAWASELLTVRHYVPDYEDGLEPTDFDVYYDVPAKSDKDLA
jgi:hypothetical protein